MHTALVCILALSVVIAGVSAGMSCGVAGTCPNVLNKLAADDGKSFCCQTDVMGIPYCCSAADYAKFKWDRFVGSVSSADSTKVGTAAAIGAVILAFLV